MKDLLAAYIPVSTEFLNGFTTVIPTLTNEELIKRESFARNYSYAYNVGLSEMSRSRIETNNVGGLSVTAKAQKKIACEIVSSLSLLTEEDATLNDILNKPDVRLGFQNLLESVVSIDDAEQIAYGDLYIEFNEQHGNERAYDIKFSNILRISHINLPTLLGGVFQFVVSFSLFLPSKDFISLVSLIILSILKIYKGSTIELSDKSVPILKALILSPEKYRTGIHKQDLFLKVHEISPRFSVEDFNSVISNLASIKAIEEKGEYIVLQEDIHFLGRNGNL